MTFNDVLMLAGDGEPRFGAPFISGATVTGEIVEQTRGPKMISFKKRRRQNSKRKRGHRQDLTVVKITSLSRLIAAGFNSCFVLSGTFKQGLRIEIGRLNIAHVNIVHGLAARVIEAASGRQIDQSLRIRTR